MSELKTKAATDWQDSSLAIARDIIVRGYEEAFRTIEAGGVPLAMNPNRVYGQGYLRWLYIDTLFYEACSAGQLPGITASFRANKSGPGSLELVGKETRTLISHISSPDETPHHSDLREQAQVSNQLLLDFKDSNDIEEDGRLRLVLVHSGTEFAALRAYYDPENPSFYMPFGGNIMTIALPNAGYETEAIHETAPNLIPAAVAALARPSSTAS